MNDKTKFIVAAITTVTIISIPAINHIRVSRIERKKQQEIYKNYNLDLKALYRTIAEYEKRINNGDYDGQIDKLLDDSQKSFEFYKMIVRI